MLMIVENGRFGNPQMEDSKHSVRQVGSRAGYPTCSMLERHILLSATSSLPLEPISSFVQRLAGVFCRAEEAISALLEAADDDDEGVAEMAVWALEQIDPEDEVAEAA